MLTPFPFATPPTTTSLHSHTHGTEALLALLPKTEILFDPQHRMPAQLLNGLIQPSGIQAPVSHHNHLPVSRHHPFQCCKQSFPIGPPFSLLTGSDDFPSYW